MNGFSRSKEARGIQLPVAQNTLVGRMYDFLSVRSFSAMLGCIEIGTAALISLQYLSPKTSAFGAIVAIGLFATTLSMLFTTSGWEPTLRLPRPIGDARTVLLKDLVSLGASVWLVGESLKAIAG